MKSAFATTWKSSVQPRKQRKYVYNAPYHVKGKLLGVHLVKDLQKKYQTRNVRVRVGDKVKILRGTFKGKEGKVERVDAQRTEVYVAKIEHVKPDGTRKPIALHPSNLTIIELDLGDKKRKAKLESATKKESKKE